jgi:hypothetical protein
MTALVVAERGNLGGRASSPPPRRRSAGKGLVPGHTAVRSLGAARLDNDRDGARVDAGRRYSTAQR